MAASSSNSGSGSGNRRIMSIVEDHGVYNSRCGYCKSRRSSISHGLTAHRLTVNDYQELLDRGWRRSGTHLYLPDRSKTCCPPYTIRLEADAFVPSKEQKRVRRRMNRFLAGEYEGPRTEDNVESKRTRKVEKEGQDELSTSIRARLTEVIADWVKDSGLGPDFHVPDVTVRRISEKIKRQLADVDGEAKYTSNAAFLVASAVKRIRNDKNEQDKMGKSDIDVSSTDVADSLASKFIDDDVTVKACKGHLNFYISSNMMQDVNRMSEDTHTAPDVKINHEQRRQHTLEIRMQRSAFDLEEFQLYKKYQIVVHNDKPEDVREASYRRFLVDSPLVPVQIGSTSYGSFHQQYRIDGRLVAVGVVDVLPKCLSSKYLFWDPDFAFLSLGKFSALQEIEWVQAAHRSNPLLQYYYLGFYIHTCPKMRYKAAYFPSDLLCPTDFTWVPFSIARPLVENAAVCICISDMEASATQNSADRGAPPSNDEDGDMNDTFEMQDDDPEEIGLAIDNMQDNELPIDSGVEKLGDIPMLLLQTSRCVLFKELEAAGIFGSPLLLKAIKWQLYRYSQLVGDKLSCRIGYIQPIPFPLLG